MLEKISVGEYSGIFALCRSLTLLPRGWILLVSVSKAFYSQNTNINSYTLLWIISTLAWGYLLFVSTRAASLLQTYEGIVHSQVAADTLVVGIDLAEVDSNRLQTYL